ncbi:MAG: phage protease, partial [Burkholderiaceae bacterium]
DDGTNNPPTGPDGRTTMSKPTTDDEFRTALGLAADADVNAALKSLLSEREENEPETDAEKEAREAAEKAAQDKAAADAKAKADADAKAAEGTDPPAGEPATVQLSAEQYKNLTELADATAARNRTDALDRAVRTGRIAPSERKAYADQMDRDEAGTTALLSALAPARFPVTSVGEELTADAALSAATTSAYDDFEADTFGLAKS